MANRASLILIPGLLSDEAVWKEQVKAFSSFQIFIPKFSFESSTEDFLNTILAKAPPKFLLAGHSMGGWLALEVMRQCPQRVEKLCLLATSATLDSEEKRKGRLMSIQKAEEGKFSEVAEKILDAFVYQQDIRNTVKEMFIRNQKSFSSQEKAMLEREDCSAFLSTIRVPTTVIVGDQDREFFQSSQEIANKIPNAKFAVVRECGHMLTLENPQEVNSFMLQWANSVED